jgi:short-chain Z-isoprenyl diphosphate synthase
MTGPLRTLYARRLRRQVMAGPLPEHVGLIMDGNRRWARQMGMADPSLGHKYGAEHAENVLTCWPAFREIDFLRALRSFAARQRRFGG